MTEKRKREDEGVTPQSKKQKVGIKSIEDIPTPAILVHIDRVERNTTRMLARCKERNIGIRPHVKTHKSIQAAKLQTGTPNPKIVVSTLKEAKFFAQGGFRNILYAVPIIPIKLALAANLRNTFSDLTLHLLLDNADILASVIEHGQQNNLVWSVFLKIDTGYHRHGVDPVKNKEECVQLVQKMNAAHKGGKIHFRGLYSHAGHSYNCKTTDEIAAVAAAEVNIMSDFVEHLELKKERIPEVISVGSTPASSFLPVDMRRVTEIHPGNYTFYDTTQADLGSCKPDDVAVTLLTRIIGIYPDRGTLIVDAGALALSKDSGANKPGIADRGYGLIQGYEELILAKVSQEVGIVKRRSSVTGGAKISDFKVGQMLKITPNHSCLTCACHRKYYAISNTGETTVAAEWETCNGWF